MHGQLVAKLAEVVCKSEHEKLTHMLNMVERRVLVSLLSNKLAIPEHVLQVIILFLFLLDNLPVMIRHCDTKLVCLNI